MLHWKTTFIRNRVISFSKRLSHPLILILKKEVFQCISPPNKVNINAKKKNIIAASINIEAIFFIM